MSFVVDSSVALSWCFPDEATDSTEGLYDLARRTELIVPPLWHIEMANVLGLSLKRGRSKASALDEALMALSRLRLRTVTPREANDVAAYTTQMQIHQLTAYDATYIMLARELSVPLATFDAEMIRAADRCGVFLIRFGG